MTPHWKPLITAVIGLSASSHCHFSGSALIAYTTPEKYSQICMRNGIAYGTSR